MSSAVPWSEAHLRDINMVLHSPNISAAGSYYLGWFDSAVYDATGEWPGLDDLTLAAAKSNLADVLAFAQDVVRRKKRRKKRGDDGGG